MCESDYLVAPWALFQLTYGKSTTVHETAELVHGPRPAEDAPRERSPYEEEEWSHGRHGYYNVVPPGSRE